MNGNTEACVEEAVCAINGSAMLLSISGQVEEGQV